MLYEVITHLGMDPEVKNFKGDRKLAKFSVATSQSYIGSNGERVHRITSYNVCYTKLLRVIVPTLSLHWLYQVYPYGISNCFSHV